jgi:hypothetical protein
MPELVQIPGSHHCIGTSRAVADLIFKNVHSQAVANGGMISAEEVLSLKAQFILNLPSGIDFFEKINRQCAHAGQSAATNPLSREHILPTLLSVCAQGSAKHAFRLQIENFRSKWIDCFFQGLAQVVRGNINEEAWRNLIAAYVHTAETNKAKMQVLDLLARKDVKEIISDGLAPLYNMFKLDEIAKSTCAQINDVIAREYKIAGPSIVKITDEDLMTFLTMLQKEMPIRLHPPVTSEMAKSGVLKMS